MRIIYLWFCCWPQKVLSVCKWTISIVYKRENDLLYRSCILSNEVLEHGDN